MTNTMTYKGYSARIAYDDEDGVFTGRIACIRDGVGFHADNVEALRQAFHEAVEDAFLRLKRANAQCIFVNRRDEHDEYGIVVLADIAKKVIAPDRSPERINVYEIMSKPAVSVPPDMNIRYAARLFAQFGNTIAPVIDAGKVQGIVTSTSIVLEGLSLILEG